ncbi:hypothetical protein KEU06_08880 [Pseudaminobacter sp. 19-2017]|uniref:HD domain-containing protein n=1 Tax=Pseudaminobacter soli (ex Zhang et al. 2022) TaxID=2831468 RepID=A0A942DXD0_9HYPH|nr:hypothetical protein [Pseudaminobacter soli]MBS3648742.1 hypothetical protein [Pseudaminobacter soli]
MSWIKTGTGRRIDFLNPDPTQITLFDIANSLSRVSRFNGHSPLKVGQHICEVAHLMMERASGLGMSDVEIAEAGIVGLVHDFPEFAVVDVPTPLKRLLGDVYKQIEARVLAAVVERFDLHGLMEKYDDLLQWADRQAVVEEALRFQIDGYYLHADGTEEDTEFEWVDPNTPRLLNDDVIWDHEDDRLAAVVAGFIRLMQRAGRIDVMTDDVAGGPLSQNPVDDSYRNPLPALLRSGETYF